MERKIKCYMGSITIIDDTHLLLKSGFVKKEFAIRDLVDISTSEPTMKQNGAISFVFTSGQFTIAYQIWHKQAINEFIEEINKKKQATNSKIIMEYDYAKFLFVDYKGGHPQLNKECKVELTITNKAVKMVFGSKEIQIEFNDIDKISFETIEQINSRITATRLATLGVFALALKKKEKDTIKYVTIDFHDDIDIEQTVVLGGKAAETIYSRLYSAFSNFKKQNKDNEKLESKVQDPYEELKKIKELLDLGIITQEEFDIKKKELLNL